MFPQMRQKARAQDYRKYSFGTGKPKEGFQVSRHQTALEETLTSCRNKGVKATGERSY
jgi:hypothetical protein